MQLMKSLSIVLSMGILLSSGVLFADDSTIAPPAQQLAPTIDQLQNLGIANGLYTNPPPPLAGNPIDTSAANIATQHFQTYQTTTDPDLLYGDMKITTMVSPDSYTAAQQAAAQQFINNLVNTTQDTTAQLPAPLISNPLTGGYSIDPASAATFAKGAVNQSLLSVARQIYAEIYARRLPSANLTPPPGGGSITLPGTIMQMISSDPSQRFYNSSWQATNQTNLNTALCLTPTGAQMSPSQCTPNPSLYTLIQIAQMMAWQNAVFAEKFRQDELSAALLSAKMVQDNMVISKLNALLSASTGATSAAASTSGR